MNSCLRKEMAKRYTGSARKRGRPPQNGLQPPEILFRALEAIHVYHQIRLTGAKHSVAVAETVARLKPRYKISPTTVKRALAEFQPSGANVVFTVTNPNSLENVVLGDAKKIRVGLTLGVGARPIYPRFNASQDVSH